MHDFTDKHNRIELASDESLDKKLINVRLIEFNEDRTALKAEIVNS